MKTHMIMIKSKVELGLRTYTAGTARSASSPGASTQVDNAISLAHVVLRREVTRRHNGTFRDCKVKAKSFGPPADTLTVCR